MVGITKRLSSIALTGAVLLLAPLASAQTYYYSSPSLYDQAYGSYTGACVNLTRDLSPGSQGSDVSSLQTFLVSRNYPGGGNWMVTGYYGAATAAAVRNFQSAQNLPATGYVDAQTRAAVNSVSCGGTAYNYNNAYAYQQYGQQYGNQNQYTPFNYSYTYPYTQPTYTYPLGNCGYNYGSNSYGYNYGGYGYTGIGTYYDSCSNNYNQYQIGTPSISLLSPNSGAVGASVTVFGSGFTTTGNTVHFGNGVITNLGSPDGRSVSFTVPTQLTGYGSQVVGLGTYYVSVTNAAGFTSNTVPFTVSSLGAAGAPTITNVSGPTNLGVNAQGVWTLTTNNFTNSYISASVQWGDPQYYGYAAAVPQQIIGSGSQTLTFTHAYAQAGTYTIVFTVSNAAGQSNTSTITVNVSGSSTGSLTITSITPSTGRVGTQIAIQGSGFSLYDNAVHFGSGGTMHVPSYNGTTIYYTVPQYLSPCDLSQSTVCPMYLQLVTPGTYPISVTTGSGTSNTQNFTVTQ